MTKSAQQLHGNLLGDTGERGHSIMIQCHGIGVIDAFGAIGSVPGDHRNAGRTLAIHDAEAQAARDTDRPVPAARHDLAMNDGALRELVVARRCGAQSAKSVSRKNRKSKGTRMPRIGD